jgi:hypothetical protein
MSHAVRIIGLAGVFAFARLFGARPKRRRTYVSQNGRTSMCRSLQKDRNSRRAHQGGAANTWAASNIPTIIQALDADAGPTPIRACGPLAAAGALWKSGKASEPVPRASGAGARRPLAAVCDPRGRRPADARHVERRTRRRPPARVRHPGHSQQRPLHGSARTGRPCAARDAALPDPRVPGARRRAAAHIGAQYRGTRELRERCECARASWPRPAIAR